MKDNEDLAKVLGLILGLIVVLALNFWIFPNDLTRTIVRVMASP